MVKLAFEEARAARPGKRALSAFGLDALDRGATGLTFYDDDTTKFFSPHSVAKSPLLMVAVGVPLSKTKSE